MDIMGKAAVMRVRFQILVTTASRWWNPVLDFNRYTNTLGGIVWVWVIRVKIGSARTGDGDCRVEDLMST